MESIKKIFEETKEALRKCYSEGEADKLVYILFEDLLGISRTPILLNEDRELDHLKLNGAISRLLNNEPIQHVTGFTYFLDRKFKTDKRALIPRPETEELVKIIVAQNELDNPAILDIGTGTGCIAISLSLEIESRVSALDISQEALELARKNASHLNAKVEFLELDVLTSELPSDQFDIIVSNPPYIPKREQVEMDLNVTHYDPSISLFVPDDDPLLFYKRIGELGLKSLIPSGKLYFEIHEKYGDAVKEQLEDLGYYDVIVYQDINGKNRIVSATN